MSRWTQGRLEGLDDQLTENQALLSLVGALGGVVLAIVVERVGPDPDPASFAITVNQARATLLSFLALLFTGLSIVLALSALAAQNTANRFSLRLFRLRLRVDLDKVVVAGLALSGSYVITTQLLLRARPGDTVTPPASLLVSVVLVVLSAVLIFSSINSTMQSIRVDRTIRFVAGRILRAAELTQREHRHDVAADPAALERPPGAIDLAAPADGYVVGHDMKRLEQLATARGTSVVIEAEVGCPLVRGETTGWVNDPSLTDPDHLRAMADCVTVKPARDVSRDAGYAISVLVDIALMAASPAVNDPHTAVQCIEELAIVFTTLADQGLGSRARLGSDGAPRVVVRGETVGDHLDFAGREILLYGRDDPTMTAALLRLAHQVERVVASDRDRELARSLADDIERVRDMHVGP
jgi:uncharacterized membrane protein